MRTSVPLYHHLKSTLLSRIEEGKWSAGELIPSESELADEFHVSRTTVRQAVGDLVSSGYLVRQQGKGTFVATRSTTMATSPLYGFAEELRMHRTDVRVNVRSIELTACPGTVAKRLGILTEPVIHVSRTAHSTDACVFHESSYLLPPTELSSEELAKRPDLFDHIYGFLERHGVKIGLARQTVTAELASDEDLQVLGLAKGDAVLVIRRVTQDITGTPVEFSEVRYPASEYEYQVNLHREER